MSVARLSLPFVVGAAAANVMSCRPPPPRRPADRVEGPAQRVQRDMVQERRRFLLRLPRCSLTYLLGGLGHAFPALCPARAFASRIPLGRGPSLPGLRRGSRPVVRLLRRYYGPVRLLHPVHLRLRIPPSLRGPGTTAGQSEDLPGPGGGRTYVPGVSDAAKLPRTSPCRGADDVAFDGFERLGASEYPAFGAQYPCPHAPLDMFDTQPLKIVVDPYNDLIHSFLWINKR